MLKVLQNSQFKGSAYLSEKDTDNDNYYSIIENAKDLIKDNDWWIIKEESEKKEEKLESP